MILYDNDIYDQNAYIDITTNNISFIRMSKILQMLGIKNNRFFLSLYDKDLRGRDPHNLRDNSLELRLRVAAETKRNVWYYLREVCKVPSAGGDGSSEFLLNRYNLALTWVTFNNIDSFSTILRQIGKTTIVLSLDAYLMYLRESNYSTGFISKDADAVQEAVKRIKIIRDLYPPYLIHKNYRDGDNKEGLTYESLNNDFKTFIAQKSVIQARKQARGLSMPSQDHDEFGYQDNNEVLFPSSVSATTAAREQALAKGSIAVLKVATTAADPDTPAGKYAFKIKEECMFFQDKFYDCKDRDELWTILSQGSKRKMFYITYNHKQLGKTDEWLEDVLARVGCTEEEADRDYRNIWRRGGVGGALSPEDVKIISASLREPNYTEIIDGFIFNWYVTKTELESDNFKNRPLVLGMDSAENIGHDYSTLFLLDPLTFLPVMSFRCNSSNLNKFAKFIFNLMVRFPKIIWIPERNHVGAMVVDTVIELLENIGENPFHRIYNTIVNDAKNIYDIDKNQEIVGSVKATFGFRTHGGSGGRKMLYSTTFDEVIKRNKDKICDNVLIDQIRELQRKNGRVDHAPGKNDDMVISYLLCSYLLFFGKNLDFYGIKPSDIMSFDLIIENTEEINQEVAVTITKEKYLDLFRQMKEMENQINNCTSILLKSKLEGEVRELKDYLKIFNVDEDIITRQQLIEVNNDNNFQTALSKERAMKEFFKYF